MKHVLLLIAALLAACSGGELPQHMTIPDGVEKPTHGVTQVRYWGAESEEGAPLSDEKSGAFTLPDGYGFGVFPPGGHGNPASITDSACTNAYVHQPVHSVDRCNIPKYKRWEYRITGANYTELNYIRDAVDAVNEIALYDWSGVEEPYSYTTSSNARVRFDFVSYTPEYDREKFVKVRISDSYKANSQIGPIRRYGKCHVYINKQHLQNEPFDDPNDVSHYRNFIHALAMKGAWQCLGRGTDYYALTWRCQPHHMTGISPPETCGESGLTNADMDHVEPFFDVEMPRDAGTYQNSPLAGWASWGDKINLEYLWLYFDPN